MAEAKAFNLFVYGTLMNPSIFRAVLGRGLVTDHSGTLSDDTHHARKAVLNGYTKVSPDKTYLYALPDPHGRIQGYLICDLPGECASALRHYEGRNYVRKKLRVQTSSGPETAVVFVGRSEQIDHSFGYEFRDHFKQEVILDRKIDDALQSDDQSPTESDRPISRRVVRELRGSKIRDLQRKHFEAGGISDYIIRKSLSEQPLPDFSRIAQNRAAGAIASNYLSMVVRQVIFNEFEERIHQDFRYELDRMDRGQVYYNRAFSSLAALRMANNKGSQLRTLTNDCLENLDFRRDHLVDYVRHGVQAADLLYESAWAKSEVDFIRNHMGSGHTPLGAELEFSNIGHDVVRDPQGQSVQDARYDGFLYFRDFGLDVLTWRLGGHLDDHHKKASAVPRRGFFEVALGNLSVEANLSKPITDDPWLLSQFIQQTRSFFEITPHSVHISMQIPGHHPAKDRVLPIAAMKCLFALAGDPARLPDGRVVIGRLVSGEITGSKPDPHLLFSQVSRRHSTSQDMELPNVRSPQTRGVYVQQYKFLRLTSKLNYEPIIMAMKGIQISSGPGSFLTGFQFKTHSKHRQLFNELVAWGKNATTLSTEDVEVFLSAVYDGLMTERRGKPAHSGAYIAWSINRLRSQLTRFNELIEGIDSQDDMA